MLESNESASVLPWWYNWGRVKSEQSSIDNIGGYVDFNFSDGSVGDLRVQAFREARAD